MCVSVCVGMSACACAFANVRVHGQHLHKCGNSQNTNPKKTFVTFCETFYTMVYIFWRAVPVGVVGERGGPCAGSDRTQQLRQARKSQAWRVCVLL